jgi:aryl-alcohol dehydrogenase-like predicted oxidoreductase
MDYLKRDWPPRLVQHWFDLTETQIHEILEYLQTHREEVEAEYQQVVQEAEELRRSYEEQNRERVAQIAALPPKPGTEALWAKLKAQKARHEQEEQHRAEREKSYDNTLSGL